MSWGGGGGGEIKKNGGRGNLGSDICLLGRVGVKAFINLLGEGKNFNGNLNEDFLSSMKRDGVLFCQ